jgi:two-component system invasion response regulator UvrY
MSRALDLSPSTMARRDSSGKPADRPVGVLTVDDQEVFRELARLVVEATPGFESLGEFASGEEALRAVDDLDPDLVVMDVRMPGMDGIETTRRIRAVHPEVVVVLISVEDPVDIPSAAQTSGAVALVRKEDFKPTLLAELWAAHGRVQR